MTTLISCAFTEKSNVQEGEFKGKKYREAGGEGGLPKQEGLAQFADLRGPWQERGVWYF